MNLLGSLRRRSSSSEPRTPGTCSGLTGDAAAEDDDEWRVDVEEKLKLPTYGVGPVSGGSAASKGTRFCDGVPGRALPATAVRPNSRQVMQSKYDSDNCEERQRRTAQQDRQRAEELRQRAEQERRRAEEERQRAEQERRRAEEEYRRAEEERQSRLKKQLEDEAKKSEEQTRRLAEAAAAHRKAQNPDDYCSVQLPMYDLSNGLARFVPAALLSGYKFEGVWHTGVRVFGKEIWFGGCVLESEFDESPFGIPQRVVRLGKTIRTYKELMEFIHDELAKAYNSRTYDVLGRNCNHFSNEIVQFLLGGMQIPEEVLMQPQWAQSGTLVPLLRPALNAWLGGFGGQDSLGTAAPRVVHMTRAEKEREQRRLEVQWKEWVAERQRERAVEEAEHRREAEDEEFQSWMLEQHQRMQQQDQEEERRKREEEARKVERQAAERQQEAEQTLRDILASADVVDAAVIEWAFTEAKAAGVEATAPYLLRDAEFAMRKKLQQ